jgi:transposase-like protein
VKKKRKYRVYSLEFKLEAVRRLMAGEGVISLSRILAVPRNLLYYWLNQYREQGAERLRRPGRPTFEDTLQIQMTPQEVAAKRVAELEQKVGQQILEVDFLKRAFKRVKASRQSSSEPGASAYTERSGQ